MSSYNLQNTGMWSENKQSALGDDVMICSVCRVTIRSRVWPLQWVVSTLLSYLPWCRGSAETSQKWWGHNKKGHLHHSYILFHVLTCAAEMLTVKWWRKFSWLNSYSSCKWDGSHWTWQRWCSVRSCGSRWLSRIRSTEFWLGIRCTGWTLETFQ
jgi:hypothetical protein